MSIHFIPITPKILYSNHLLKENVELAVAVAGQVEILYDFDQISVGYFVNIVGNFANNQFADLLLKMFGFPFQLVNE